MSLVRRGLVVPACAASHTHWFVKLFVEWALLVFANRANLKRPIRDLNGHVLVPALPEWYVRPYVRAGGREDAKALDKRRADFMQDRLAAILVVVAHMSFREKVVLPDPKAPDYMTLEQLGRELPGMREPEKAPRCKDPVDAIERAMRFLKMIGFFSKVVQHRQKLADGPNAGKFRTYGAALRRVGSEWMLACEGMIAGGWQRLQNYLKEKAKEKVEKKKKADDAFTAALTRKDDPILVPPRHAPAAAETEPTPDPLWAEVEHDHREWVEAGDVVKIRAEVNRRAAERRRPDTS